jgi:integrase
MAVVSAIARGSFDYRQHFPRGSRLQLFYPDDLSRDGHTTRLGDYLAQWHRTRSPILDDGTVVRDADLHPSTWIHDASTLKSLTKSLGHLRLAEITTAQCNQLRRRLIEDRKSGKTVVNIMGLLHKALSDAVSEGLIERNPILRVTTRRTQRSRRQRVTADPLTPVEVLGFLEQVPREYYDLYAAWFRLGWRSSEIVALRFGWLDRTHQTVKLRSARMPRNGGIEAEPKTGPREVDCSYAPEIFEIFSRIQTKSFAAGPDDFVFRDRLGRPLSQEWLHKRVWKPTLRRADIDQRGQYAIRDTFISLALWSGEDPGWVAQVCGTSEQMIFRHYRRSIPSLRVGAGRRINRLFETTLRVKNARKVSLETSLATHEEGKAQEPQGDSLVEAGGIEPPSEGIPAMATTRLVRTLELAPIAPVDGLYRSKPV